jgi:tRNA-specific 2-thiouridylase
MGRQPPVQAPAVPDVIFAMRGPYATASASRIMFSITKAIFARPWWTGSPTITSLAGPPSRASSATPGRNLRTCYSSPAILAPTAADPARDQSYFLFATTQAQLDYLRFPLGGLPKARVRELAAEMGFGVAAKPDSQDICFVPDGNYAGLVRKLRPDTDTAGEIVDLSGRALGRHRGLIHFTVGQRRGLEIGGQDEPLYVVRLEAESRRVVVGPRRALAVDAAQLSGLNWIGGDHQGPLTAKVRSMAKPVPAQLVGDRLVFDEPEYGVAPGQAAVLYAGERVLGGGWIERTEAAALAA